MPTEVVAEALGCSRARVGHLEGGRNPPRKTDVIVMAELYGAKDRLPALLELWEEANAKGWWSTYKLPAWMQAYVGLEADATVIRCFTLELVPGLLQNADYARGALLRQGVPEDEVSRHVSVRMERQRRLGEIELEVIVSEALLARTIHMEPYGATQLKWLVDAMGVRGVKVRVFPFAAGGHRSMLGSFTLLEFPKSVSGPVAYREGVLHGDLIDDQQPVGDLYEVYEDLRTRALSVEDSVELIGRYVTGARG
jgi:hypothetical protein